MLKITQRENVDGDITYQFAFLNIILNIKNLQIYKVAWSPHIFSDKITNFMIKYSMKEKREIKLLRINHQKLCIRA